MIQARTKTTKMAPPTLERMIRVADLETGGYWSLGGSKVVVYIVVTVVASGMIFYTFGEAQEGKLGEFRQRFHRFSPFILSCPRPGGDELTKSKKIFRKIDISAFRFSSNFVQVRIILSPRFFGYFLERKKE